MHVRNGGESRVGHPPFPTNSPVLVLLLINLQRQRCAKVVTCSCRVRICCRNSSGRSWEILTKGFDLLGPVKRGFLGQDWIASPYEGLAMTVIGPSSRVNPRATRSTEWPGASAGRIAPRGGARACESPLEGGTLDDVHDLSPPIFTPWPNDRCATAPCRSATSSRT